MAQVHFIELIDKFNQKTYINSRNTQVSSSEHAKAFESQEAALKRYDKLLDAGRLKQHKKVNIKSVNKAVSTT